MKSNDAPNDSPKPARSAITRRELERLLRILPRDTPIYVNTGDEHIPLTLDSFSMQTEGLQIDLTAEG